MNLLPENRQIIARNPLGSTLDRARGILTTSYGLVDDVRAFVLLQDLQKSPVAESLKPPGLRDHLKFYLKNALGAINSLPLDKFGPLAAAVRDGRPDEEIWDAAISLVQVLNRPTSQRGLMSTMGAPMDPSDAPALPDKFDKKKTTFTQCCYNYNQYLMYLLHTNGLLKGVEIPSSDMTEIEQQAGANRNFCRPSSHTQKDAYLPTATIPWEDFRKDTNDAYTEAFRDIIASKVHVFSSPSNANTLVNGGHKKLIQNENDLQFGLDHTLFRHANNIVGALNELKASPSCPPSFQGVEMEVANYTPPTSRKTVDLGVSLIRDKVRTEVIVIELKTAGRDEMGIRLVDEQDLQYLFKESLKDKDFLGRILEEAKNKMSQPEQTKPPPLTAQRTKKPKKRKTLQTIESNNPLSSSKKPRLGLVGEILSQIYEYMLESGTSYGVVTDGFFLLFLTFGTTDRVMDYGKLKYHFANYNDYRNVTVEDLTHKPESPLTLLLCLTIMASRNEVLARREEVKKFRSKATKVADFVKDSMEHDKQNPVHQGKRRKLFHGASGSQTKPDVTDREQAPFCTPQCLEGLCQGGFLDPECPNFEWHRHLDKSVLRHKLTVEQVKEGLIAQMDLNDQTLFAHLGYMDRGGLIGMPFRITLISHGYTMVGKGVSNKHYHDLVEESNIYDRLPTAQGNLIPVSLGVLSMKRAKVTFFRGRVIQHFLLLSWGGDRFSGRESDEVLEMVREAEKQLCSYGLSHNDLHYGNVLWHPQLHKPFIIDLERATLTEDDEG